VVCVDGPRGQTAPEEPESSAYSNLLWGMDCLEFKLPAGGRESL
jgi:hypothetical protein